MYCLVSSLSHHVVFIASIIAMTSSCLCVTQLAGAVILGVGIWVKVDSSSLFGILESVKDAPPQLSHLASVGYVLIGVGAFLVVIGFLGCCGAVRESRCMLLTVSGWAPILTTGYHLYMLSYVVIHPYESL